MNLATISGVRAYVDNSGLGWLNLEDAARGLGIVKVDTKGGKEYTRINKQLIVKLLNTFGNQDSEDIPEYISEDAFYYLAIKANNATAVEFQTKVCKVILPSIRKTGQYNANPMNLPSNYLEALESLVSSTKALAIAESTVSLLMHTDKTYTSTEIAKELGFRSATAMNRWLHDINVIFEINGTTVLYSQYSNLGYYSIKQCIPGTGNVIYNSKWTQEGRRFLVGLRNKG